MSGEGFFFDNLTPEQQAAERNRAYAEAMMQRGAGNAGSAPGGGLRSAGASILGAVLANRADKKSTDLATDREGSYTRALGNFLGPKDNSAWDAGPETDASGDPGQISVSPRVGASMAQRLGATMNPDLMRQMGPQIAQQQMNQRTTLSPEDAQAQGFRPGSVVQSDPTGALSTVQQSDTKSPEAIAQEKDLRLAPTAPSPGMTPEALQQQKDLRLSPSAPTPGMSPEAFEQQKKLAQIRADIAAQTQGEFGRSMQGKAYNILAAGLTSDAARSTPEYATAWQILSNPRVDPATGTIISPDMSAFKPPTGGGAQPGPAGPDGAPPQRMPNVQSFAPPNPSQAEAGSAGYANRLSESSGIIDKNQGSGASLYNRTMSGLPGGNYAVGSDYQQLDQAERNFVNAQLRRESGAAISESEFQNARKQYFPQPGDKPEVLAQKKRARDMAVQNMQLSAGNVLLPPGVIQQSSPPKGAPIVPQQQGFGASAPGAAAPRFKIEQVQ